ncbi:MAG: hypothetical protein ACFFB0_19160 [Promethearchaeota archaeon]
MLVFFTFLSPPIVGIKHPYKFSYKIGPKIIEVVQYNKTKWNSVINETLEPNKWFSGDSNQKGVRSKFIIRWSFSCLNRTISSLISNYFCSKDKYEIWSMLQNLGYGDIYINRNYPNTYDIIYIDRTKWEFTNSQFTDKEANIKSLLYAFKTPDNLSSFIKDFFSLKNEVNNNTKAKSVGFSIFFNYTLEDFFLFLMLNQIVILEPYEEYLSSLIDNLSLNHTSVQGNTLSMERFGIEKYYIELTYGKNGFYSHFIVKDLDNKVFYKVIVYNTERSVFSILIGFSSGIVTIIAYAIYRRSKRMKKFRAQLHNLSL